MTDKEYVEKRDALIPDAVKHADEKQRLHEQTHGSIKGFNWTRCFLKKMDSLAFTNGLTSFRSHQ